MRVAYTEDGDYTISEVKRASLYDSSVDAEVAVELTGIILTLADIDDEDEDEIIIGMNLEEARIILGNLLRSGFCDASDYDEAVYRHDITYIMGNNNENNPFADAVDKMGLEE